MTLKLSGFDFLGYGSKCNLGCEYCFEDKYDNKMDFEKLKQYILENQPNGVIPFGGEPLLYINELIDLIKGLEKRDITEVRKKTNRINLKKIITNGTLVKKNIDKLKKYGFDLQISLDGCRIAHNKNRKYLGGKGSWNDILEGIFACIENGIKPIIHAVLAKNTIKYLYRTLKILFRLNMLIFGKDNAIKKLKNNIIFIIFEEDYTDNDIDTFIVQLYKFFKWIKSRKYLSEFDKKAVYDYIIDKGAVTCSAGAGFYGVSSNFNIYPCHRITLREDRDDYKLGNINDRYNLTNIEKYNSFVEVRNKNMMYSSTFNIKGDGSNMWAMWCPATNLETSGSPYYQNAKYNVLVREIQRALEWIGDEFGWL